jgi:hypothetical protein
MRFGLEDEEEIALLPAGTYLITVLVEDGFLASPGRGWVGQPLASCSPPIRLHWWPGFQPVDW